MRKNNYIKIADEKGNFTRILKLHYFRDTNKPFYIEPEFELYSETIIRKDHIYEAMDIIGINGCGFLPSSLNEFRKYCRYKYYKFKDEEVIINPLAVWLGVAEPKYDDKAVCSTKYHI